MNSRQRQTDRAQAHCPTCSQDLRNCCKACENAGLLVFGDLVFNHMQVVASCEEWRKAQQDERVATAPDDGLMEILQRRLSQKLGPTFNRDDFQWPWYPLEGDDWDGEQRMEGWGCGEWSELKGGAPKVVSVHNAHVAKLKSCGVSGFRFDAAKHMRPEHIANYVDKADVYAYGEVLSIDPKMQREDTLILPLKPQAASARDCSPGVSLTTGEQFPTTDFLLAVWLRKFVEVGPAAVDFEHHEWVKHLREIEMKRPSDLPQRAGTVEQGRMSAPILARNSIRFARNHDTVCNDVPFYGLTNWSQASAQVAAAWLLATHDGSVLLLADDVKKSRMIKEALAYRKALRKFIESLSQEQRQTIRTEVRVKEAEDGGRPLTICIAVRVDAGGPDGAEINGGALLGFCVLNPHPTGCVEFTGSVSLQQEGRIRVVVPRFYFSARLQESSTLMCDGGGKTSVSLDRTIATGEQKVVLHGDGTLHEPLKCDDQVLSCEAMGEKAPVHDPELRWFGRFGLRLGEGLRLDVVHVNAALAAGRTRAGPGTLLEIRSCEIWPDVVSLNSVMNVGAQNGQWQDVLDLLSAPKQLHLQPDLITYGSTFCAFDRGGQWHRALQMLRSMPSRVVEPNLISYNSVLAAVGTWPRAMELLVKAQVSLLLPDVISFGASQTDAWQHAAGILGRMLQISVKPKLNRSDDQVQIPRQSLACNSGSWQYALALLNAIRLAKLKPNEIAFNSVLSAISEWTRALAILSSMDRKAGELGGLTE
eukprot:g19390.t1